MAVKVVTTKRDREKLKEEKRKEKQRRKEQRQSAGPSSFEEMIAYVDENGQFHNTPPEKAQEEVDINDIVISTPKQAEAEEDAPKTGRVEYFNNAKGFGFIKDSVTSDKYFFHISAAPANIAEGNTVTFDTELSTRGMNAVHILITK